MLHFRSRRQSFQEQCSPSSSWCSKREMARTSGSWPYMPVQIIFIANFEANTSLVLIIASNSQTQKAKKKNHCFWQNQEQKYLFVKLQVEGICLFLEFFEELQKKKFCYNKNYSPEQSPQLFIAFFKYRLIQQLIVLFSPYTCMNTSTEITIDLPKLQNKHTSIFQNKLQKILAPNFIIKHTAKRQDDTARILIQRYKTQLNELQSSKYDNEFMEFSSGDNRIAGDDNFTKKKSFSFINTGREKDDSPHVRDHSINFRKRRLPKIITIKASKESNLLKNRQKESKNVVPEKMELITFYPHKEINHQDHLN